MSIEQTDTVDAIGLGVGTNNVILTIIDHLDWDAGHDEHLLLLQEKLNTYLRFVESGELLDVYPDGKNRSIVISVVGRCDLSTHAAEFFEKAREAVREAGIALRFDLSR